MRALATYEWLTAVDSYLRQFVKLELDAVASLDGNSIDSWLQIKFRRIRSRGCTIL